MSLTTLSQDNRFNLLLALLFGMDEFVGRLQEEKIDARFFLFGGD